MKMRMRMRMKMRMRIKMRIKVRMKRRMKMRMSDPTVRWKQKERETDSQRKDRDDNRKKEK